VNLRYHVTGKPVLGADFLCRGYLPVTRTFNETITKCSVLDEAVLTRQLSDDSAAERYGNSFVGAEESRLHAIVRCLKLAASV